MADLSTLTGISDARNDLYNKLEAGNISEAKATGMERILRGQESLKAHVPIRLLGIVTKWKGSQAEKYVERLVRDLLVFTGGPKALPEGEV